MPRPSQHVPSCDGAMALLQAPSRRPSFSLSLQRWARPPYGSRSSTPHSIDGSVNWELCFLDQLFLHHSGPKKHPHYWAWAASEQLLQSLYQSKLWPFSTDSKVSELNSALCCFAACCIKLCLPPDIFAEHSLKSALFYSHRSLFNTSTQLALLLLYHLTAQQPESDIRTHLWVQVQVHGHSIRQTTLQSK